MLHKILNTARIYGIALGIVALGILPVLSFAATNPIPDTLALFSTSLQSPITSTATSLILTSATYDGGSFTLPASTYGFIIDEGTSVEELVTADCTGVTCINVQRGISRLSGTTTISVLQFPHRRGASVKITNAPVLLILNRILQGIGTLPNPIKYNSIATTTLGANRNNVPSVGLVQDLAFNGAGVVNATTNASGVTQLATQLQTASSTTVCSSGASCVIPSANATSTYNSATAALRVVVTQNSGKIDENFIPNPLANSYVFSNATTTISGTCVGCISSSVTKFPQDMDIANEAFASIGTVSGNSALLLSSSSVPYLSLGENVGTGFNTTVVVPPGMATTSSISLLVVATTTGNIAMAFRSESATSTPFIITRDIGTPVPLTFASAASTNVSIITVPVQAYNESLVTGGSHLTLSVMRDGSGVADTFGGSLYIYGIIFNFAP